jgi:hypothetical protein
VWGKELSRGLGELGKPEIFFPKLSLLFNPWAVSPAIDILTIRDVHGIEHSLKIETYQTAVFVRIYTK